MPHDEAAGKTVDLSGSSAASHSTPQLGTHTVAYGLQCRSDTMHESRVDSVDAARRSPGPTLKSSGRLVYREFGVGFQSVVAFGLVVETEVLEGGYRMSTQVSRPSYPCPDRSCGQVQFRFSVQNPSKSNAPGRGRGVFPVYFVRACVCVRACMRACTCVHSVSEAWAQLSAECTKQA